MTREHLDTMDHFTLETLPSLDTAVLGALELFSTTALPSFDFTQYKRPLVIGSQNAAVTGRILFRDTNAVFADESTYQECLARMSGIDGAVLISASGGKHSIEIARDLQSRKIPTWLLTNNSQSEAGEHISKDRVVVFPKNREPYTYNTSTYLGMILSKTKEDPKAIQKFIESRVQNSIPRDLFDYDSFFLIVPSDFDTIRGMFMTKFDELFGSIVSGRVFTIEQAKHGKAIVPSTKEFFVSFGDMKNSFRTESIDLKIPLPPKADFAALLSIGYYFIGHIQKQHPPYFKEHLVRYTKEASQVFGQEITPIVP